MSSAPPLAGRTVLVTRAAREAGALARRLEELGASVLAVPTIRFSAVDDRRDWEAALERRSRITHLVITSKVAARHFLELTRHSGLEPSEWRPARVAVTGGGTAAVLEEAGLAPDLVARRGTGIGVATELVEREGVGPGSVLLLPRSDIARADTAEYLEAAGATVLAVAIYTTRPERPEEAIPLLRRLEEGRRVDAVTFASPSALEGLLEMTGSRGRELLASGETAIVTIGPTTSGAVRDAGLEVAAEADHPSAEALAGAVAHALGRRD